MIRKEKFKILEKTLKVTTPENNLHLGQLIYLKFLAKGGKEALYVLLKYVPLENLGFNYRNIDQYSNYLRMFDKSMLEELKPLILTMKRAIIKKRTLIYYLCGQNKFLNLIKDILDNQTDKIRWTDKYKNLATNACKFGEVEVLRLLFDYKITITLEIFADLLIVTALHKFKHNPSQKLHVWYLSESEIAKRERVVNELIHYYNANNYDYNKKLTFNNSLIYRNAFISVSTCLNIGTIKDLLKICFEPDVIIEESRLWTMCAKNLDKYRSKVLDSNNSTEAFSIDRDLLPNQFENFQRTFFHLYY